MTKYGEAFQMLRKQKQLPLSYFEEAGVNKGDLSRFENGKVMMGFERIESMLQIMNVSLSEYEFLINHHVLDYQEEFLSQLEIADFAQNQDKLAKLFDEAQSSGEIYLSLAVKACVQPLQPKEYAAIGNFLHQVEQWGYFELSLAYFTLKSLPTSDLSLFCQEFETKCGNYITIPKYYRRIYQIAYRAVILLSLRQEEILAKRILHLTDYPQREHTDFYIATLKMLAQGVINLTFDDDTFGQAQINEALKLIERLGNQNLLLYYEKEIHPDSN